MITQLETDLLSVNALPSTHRGQGEVFPYGCFLVTPVSVMPISRNLLLQYRNFQYDHPLLIVFYSLWRSSVGDPVLF